MANTLQLRRRIKTAQNVSKTTRAMQLIAASKLRRAQEATLASRPYVEKLVRLSQNVGKGVEKNDFSHPYLKNVSESGKKLLVVFSPDKGLCGGLITNLLREVFAHKDTEYNMYLTVGKKIEHSVVRLGKNLIGSFPFGTTLPDFEFVFPLLKIIEEYYLGREVESVEILTTKFESLFSQKAVIIKLLPISIEPIENQQVQKTFSFELYEPDLIALVEPLLKHYIEMVLYQYLLESFLSEQSARMLSMQNATDNAKDIIEDLTLEYNKARQQKITNEILDISSASIALSEQ